ncbi:MAG: 3-dehydro-L-gulonate 2-dehydrogenase [Xanthomonadales bacterium]|nr:3-dehydro-L-gulonate 2-dehydrogenase [Gammaproteobacteria bacterium]MBT8049586.1 3-dehydro-L-gulonate 2-dehydrogenase [Gammaproteobacteria bacterium]MBT8055532.1 3-dehydro-L-gulonate 2-dehydrogenase [Gammaproteobacteria bacterium]NNJ79670.1 3-dehydro-L-gulonate 2-dehydrogenase [Xanthomonadales bacterium]NNL04328.1 3-dehydro-L-gulonate 2-dehydrogenase [Xanthomonadales bacterium]
MAPLRLSRGDIEPVLVTGLLRRDFTHERAALCARLFVEASLDGVYSHGLNRFPQFIGMVERGVVRPDREPSRVRSTGAVETWDGRLGPGNLNAWACMGRAIEMARDRGVGVVSLRNTNHWMRGGSYGLRAAGSGCIGVCMTNTQPNMPPWGGREAAVGNNPLVIAAPNEPYPILLDMAMSQFSYGKMNVHRQRGEKLPCPGGYDLDLQMTDEPGLILESELATPMGYWKGSGLAILIDLLVATLSGGSTTAEIGERGEEYGISQVFIAFDLGRVGEKAESRRVLEAIKSSLRRTPPLREGGAVRYPGQGTWQRRQQNEREGIPVDPGIWQRILQTQG